jgi:hypothetical protein
MQTTLTFLGISLIGLAVLAWAIWSYRQTPGLTRKQQLLLTALRATTLLLLVVLLTDPVWPLQKHQRTPPELAVLFDNSASIPLAARDSNIAQTLQQQFPWAALQDAQLHLYRFGSTLDPLPVNPQHLVDSLRFQQPRTNITQALQEVLQRHPRLHAIVLLTDGQYNEGPSPLHLATRQTIPIFTVAIGDTTRPRDIRVDRVETNTLTYTHAPLPITAYLQSNGFVGTTLTVTLYANGRRVAQRQHTLTQTQENVAFSFEYTPKTPGWHRVEVRTEVLEGEFTYRNNSYSVLVRVLDRKRQLLLLAAAPEPDLANLQRILNSNADFEVTARVQRDGQRFYGGLLPDTLERFDLLLLAGYPGRNADPQHLTRLRQAMEQRPFLLLLSPQTDLTRLEIWTDLLPARPTQNTSGLTEIAFQIRPEAQTHPIFTLSNALLARQHQLPPLQTRNATWQVSPDAHTLATGLTPTGQEKPLFIVRERSGRRAALWLGSGTWRWSNLPEALSPLHTLWETVLFNTIEWLTAPVEDRLVRVWPERETFNEGEPIRLMGEVYDERLLPVSDAELQVNVWDADSTRYPFRMEPLGNGRYRLETLALPQGLYFYQATATRAGLELGQDQGHFSVGLSTIEFQTPWADPHLLQQLARRTGGQMLILQTLPELADQLRAAGLLQPTETVQLAEWRLRTQWPFLIILILLLAVEWVLRKQFGLV